MSMLMNNEAALAQLSGLTKEALEEKLGRREKAGAITAALYNSDMERRKDILLAKNPAGIIAGLCALSCLTGAKKAEIVSPCAADAAVADGLKAAAEKAGLALTLTEDDFVTKTEHRSDLLVSFEELAAIAEKLAGEEPKALYAVGDGDLAEADPAMTVKAFLESQGDVPEDIKGIAVDHAFCPAGALETVTLGQLASRSGVIRVLTGKDCILDQARKEILSLRKKSCGKCTFCREGLYQLQVNMDAVAAGRGKTTNFEMSQEIAEAMLVSCNCSLGDDAGKPVTTMMEYFRDEAEAHVRRKECKAGACLAFLQIYVDPAKCQGAGECAKVCPADCIEIKPGYTALIESFDCTRCGKCIDACPNGAIVRTAGKVPRNAETAVRLKNAAAAAAGAADADDDEDDGASRGSARAGAARRHRTLRRPGR